MSKSASAGGQARRWTVYLAQDKHLDYGWCGPLTVVETRMATLLDYYLAQAEQHGSRWNIDGTFWREVYRRQRGEAAEQRLLRAVRRRKIGYSGNRQVLVWGVMSGELALRSLAGGRRMELDTGVAADLALVMENPALSGGVAGILTDAGFTRLGRGIYNLRAESYVLHRRREPLFWWVAPNGKRLLVHWDMYEKATSWGGYAEANPLAERSWDGWHVRHVGDRNTPARFARRCRFIADTVARHEDYGDAYPISSIFLLGTDCDNWTCTDDYVRFIEKYNAQSDGRIRLVDARYQDFYQAAEREIGRRHLRLPVARGTFGISWEEWPGHLAQATVVFRTAERWLRLGEARHVGRVLAGTATGSDAEVLREGYEALLDFVEHDMSGQTPRAAAIEAGRRSDDATTALAAAVTLLGESTPPLTQAPPHVGKVTDVAPGSPGAAGVMAFPWHGGKVTFDARCGGVTSWTDARGTELVPQNSGLALGQFVQQVYENVKPREVFPLPLPHPEQAVVERVEHRRSRGGVEIQTRGRRYGFGVHVTWFFHAAQPWVDVTYELQDGWTARPQSTHLCFPLNLDDAEYHYDQLGEHWRAGAEEQGGDDLPGANPALWAAETYACVRGRPGTVVLLTPDTQLVQFGGQAVRGAGVRTEAIPAQVVSVPMLNLTRQDNQIVQGGARQWRFRYRLVVLPAGRFDPIALLRQAQQFAAPPFLQVPGLDPAVDWLKELRIRFAGGPVTGVKTCDDAAATWGGHDPAQPAGFVIRLRNVLDKPVSGSLRLPKDWRGRGRGKAMLCDGLERPLRSLPVRKGLVQFTAAARATCTLALRPE